MEHFIIVPDGSIQEVPAALIQGTGVLTILLTQNSVRLFLIGAIAVNQSDPQLFGRIGSHLLLELLIVELGHRHRGNGKNRIESTDPLLLLDLIHCTVFTRGHLCNIG